jgi:hypothetical protein
VILIGDAPPNTPEEVARKREDHGGAAYWAATPYAAAVSAADEAEALRARGVPVHAFYVRRGEDVQREFEALSQMTGGGAGFLNIDSPDGARLLTDTVAQVSPGPPPLPRPPAHAFPSLPWSPPCSPCPVSAPAPFSRMCAPEPAPHSAYRPARSRARQRHGPAMVSRLFAHRSEARS